MAGGLKTTFLVHMVVALVFGLLMFLVPALWGSLVGYNVADPTITRLAGAAMLALALSSWLGSRADRWETVHIVVQMEIVFTVLAALAVLYGLFFEGAPAFGWVAFILFAAFAAAWVFFFLKLRAA